MLEFFLNVLKWGYRVIKYTFIIGFSFYVYTSINIIQKEINTLKVQNLQAYDINAEIYTQMITVIKSVINYAQEIETVNIVRDLTLANFLQDLEDKIKVADEASMNRDRIIASHIERTEENPAYDYIKSMIVYLIQQDLTDDTHSFIGTGTVIKVDSENNEVFIITNKHVCNWEEGTICFAYQDGVKYKIELVKKNEIDHDIQIVKTSKLIPGKEAVKGIKDVITQDKVYCVGNNNGNPFMYSEGTVSGFMKGTGDLIIGMPSGPGNSGSGIFTQDGYLTGLLYAGQVFEVNGGESLDTAHAICINSKILRLFLSDYLK